MSDLMGDRKKLDTGNAAKKQSGFFMFLKNYF
jgi:hypothetical protein